MPIELPPTGDVRLELADDRVARIVIDSPEVKNALTPEMAATLIGICDKIDAMPDVGAAVIYGANSTFCSGADTRRWGPNRDPASPEAYQNNSLIYSAFFRVGQLAVPTIGAIQGAAVGAGLNLALATDLRVVASDVRLTAGFLRIGLHPGGGFFSLVGRAASREVAAALGMFSETLNGSQAVAAGLAWESLSCDEVIPRAIELGQRAAADPQLARFAVHSLRTEVGPPAIGWEAALEVERGVQMWSMRRRAHRE